MKLRKKILSNPIILWILKHIALSYIALVFYSSKKKQRNLQTVTQLIKGHKNVIFAVWHGRQLIVPKFLHKLGTMNAIASKHLDAKILGMVLTAYGTNVIYGSSNKGGKEALIKALRVLRKEDNHLCITPDGPRGPRMRVNSAIIDIAKHTGAVIIPVSFSARNAKFIKSWDKFVIPYPFNEIIINYDQPINVPKHSNKEDLSKIKQQLEITLNQSNEQLDKEFNHIKIHPDDPKTI